MNQPTESDSSPSNLARLHRQCEVFGRSRQAAHRLIGRDVGQAFLELQSCPRLSGIEELPSSLHISAHKLDESFGFTWDCDAQRHLRRGLWLQPWFGDAAHHRRRLAAQLLAPVPATA